MLHRASPDWLGLARGGGVLCVLRRGTGVEALHGAEVVGSLELGLTLNAVHRCAAEAGALLGPLAGEACLALMAAGGAVGGGRQLSGPPGRTGWAQGATGVRIAGAGVTARHCRAESVGDTVQPLSFAVLQGCN